MVQPTMFPVQGIVELGPLRGESGGRKLQIVGEGIYASKCFLPERPYTLVNEVVCAELATKLELPIPARRYLEFQDKLWFGMEWRADQSNLTEQTLNNLTNKDKVADLIAFDVFVCNPDRHDGNIIVQKVSPVLHLYTFFVIDHSHALVGTRTRAQQLISGSTDTTSYLRHNRMLLALIHSLTQFDEFIGRVQALTKTEIAEVIDSVPKVWRPTPDDTLSLVPFLVRRKEQLRELLREARDCFPNLVQGGHNEV